MPSWTADEMTSLVTPTDLSETVLYNSAPIHAIFDAPSGNIQLGMGEVASYVPKATCTTSDVPNAKKGDLVTARSVNYIVTEANPDGTGFTELVLKKA